MSTSIEAFDAPLASACDEYDPNSLPWKVARQRILDNIGSIDRCETLSLADRPAACLGRVLAENVLANAPVPNHTNSAMDGYAFRAADLDESGKASLRLVGEAFAGLPFDGEVGSGECIKIMTGAVLPASADTVVMQEHTALDGAMVALTKPIKKGANVRYAGEDLQAGDVVLQKGHRLTASDLGLIASVGQSSLEVFARPKVAIFSNGDELKPVGEPLAIGELHDSNRYSLTGLLTRLGVEIIDLGTIPDDINALREVFLDADKKADLVITSAGASVGEADYVHQLLGELGEINLWKVAIKPGRPLAFGKLPGSGFFGLPGNPVSVLVTFGVFVAPAIRKLAGESLAPLSLMAQAVTTSDLRKRPGRAEFQRAVAANNEDGRLVVQTTGEQGSGILSSMRDGNCFVVLGTDTESLPAGSLVNIIFFNELYA